MSKQGSVLIEVGRQFYFHPLMLPGFWVRFHLRKGLQMIL